MIHILRYTTLCLICIAFPLHAITLRNYTTVSDDMVTLGDVFEDVGQLEHAPVAEAPPPGKKVTYDAVYLTAIAKHYQLNWHPSTQHEKVVLTRASNVITAQIVKDALFSKIAQEDLVSGQIEVYLDQPTLEIHVPVEVAPTLKVSQFQILPGGQKFSARVTAPAEGPPRLEQNITGKIIEIVDLPVLTDRKAAGDEIAEQDVTWIKWPKSKLTADVVATHDQIVGFALKRPILGGQPVHARDIQPPMLVTKGALVTILLEKGALSITTQGKALENGSRGQVIKILNTQSNRTIEGTVMGLNKVKIEMGNE